MKKTAAKAHISQEQRGRPFLALAHELQPYQRIYISHGIGKIPILVAQNYIFTICPSEHAFKEVPPWLSCFISPITEVSDTYTNGFP